MSVASSLKRVNCTSTQCDIFLVLYEQMFTQWSIVVLLIITKECCSQQVYRRQANQDVREFDRDTPCDFATAARPEWCHFDTK